MKRVKIYDQYSQIFADNQNNNELVYLTLNYGETLDTNRYTLVHQASGFSSTAAENLTEAEAISVVSNLYEVAKATGTSYTDKLVKLQNSYAEVIINFEDGRRLCRVIYSESE